jgi:type IV pilus assembly protein PilC
MLLESGVNIAASLELLQESANNRTLKKVLGQVVSDVRGGNQLSTALLKYPKVFPSVYCQLVSVGEQSGNLETVLNQVADYMERETATAKETKNALMMPAITAVIAVVVIGLLIIFILPSLAGMYESLGTELPPIALMLITLGEQAKSNALYLFLAVVVIVGSVIFYIKTPGGRYQWDKMLLSLPRLGQVRLLSELARYCRSMSLLYHAGMPLTEVMPMLIRGSNNKVLAKALTDVHEDMVKGEGLSRPMAKNKLFLPMMVQMVKVGEETGNLDVTLLAVARSYEAEAADKIHSIIALLPPAMTLIIGGVVGLIAVTLMSAMTSMYAEGF